MRMQVVMCLAAALCLPAAAQVPSTTSWVRVIHAVADAPAVDVLVGDTVAFQGLKFKDYTDYTPLPPGTYTFDVAPTGTKTVVTSTGAVTLEGGVAYTFFAVGRLSDRSLRVMGAGDDVAAPASGLVKLRVVHAAATAPTVDVYATTPYAPLAGTPPALTGVPFPFAGHYLTVPAGTYQARVAVSGTQTIAIDSGRVRLTGGTVRTVIAVDPERANGPFELIVIPDVN